ncbi:MAG TPA: ribonuclease III [Candidatus Krumholzibacteria bacterium]|nr:ribonuclease III [Candidatus Krumholzibacteria bacterium]
MTGAFRRLLGRFLGSKRGSGAPAPHTVAHLVDLEQTLDYRFRDRSLLVASLVHRSYYAGTEINAALQSNERMEFLGDSVLSLVVNEHLYKRYPERTEGELTKMKSVVVSKQILAHLAKKMDLGRYVLVSENAQRAGVSTMESVVADALEAVFGAVFIDGGFEAARRVVLGVLPDNLGEVISQEGTINYKSLLQEYIQALHKVPPRYRVHSTTGPDHDKQFAVEVVVKGNILGSGTGKTKKDAEQKAAREAYRRLTNSPAEG